LTSEQIAELLEAIRHGCEKPHTELVTLICLATGTRWSGAEQLTLHRLQDNVVAYSGSKSGKVRHVLVQAELAEKLRAHWKASGPFTSCIASFHHSPECTTIQLSEGVASHVLRHTFASHFMMSGELQNILGHSTLTMHYAHLSPNHLQDAVRFGPLSSTSGLLVDRYCIESKLNTVLHE
jgi:integrase